MSRERLDHVGRAGAAVRHVDEGELNPALVFAMGDLAEARVVGKAFVLDQGIILNGRLAALEGGFHHGASDAGFTGGELREILTGRNGLSRGFVF
jgi:hypothetical protein